MEIFYPALIIGAYTCFLFGQLVGIRIIQLNKWNIKFLNIAKLVLFFGILYSVLGLVYGAILGLLGIGTSLATNISIKWINYFYIYFSFLCLNYFVLKWTNIKPHSLKIIFSFLIAALATILYVSINNLPASIFAKRLILFAILFIPLAAVFINNKDSHEEQKRKDSAKNTLSPLVLKKKIKEKKHKTDNKILLLGIDGADWDVINSLIDKGKLPNLSKLKNNGYCARLKTIIPTSSPMIWTSIATGKTPSEHGLIHWQKTGFPGLTFLPGEPTTIKCPKDSGALKLIRFLLKKNIVKSAPYTCNDRKCKALWNILSGADEKNGVVGWLFSWPAEKINGYNVSWYTYPFEEVTNELKTFTSSNLPHRTYPEDFIKEIKNLIVTTQDLKESDLKSLNLTTEQINYRTKKYADKINPYYISKDQTFFNISKYILSKYSEKLKFFTVLFSGIDVTCHAYWPFVEEAENAKKHREEILSVSDSEVFKEQSKGFNKCIDLYYQNIDKKIGKLLEDIDENWNVFVVSDHGFKYDGSEHFDAPDGVFIAYGKDIKESSELHEVSLYDICPTVLGFLGLPIAKDMKGNFIKNAAKKEYLQCYPLTYIETYEVEEERDDERIDTPEEIEEGLKRKLRALGYIE